MGSKKFTSWINQTAGAVSSNINSISSDTLKALTNNQLTKLDPTKVANRIGDFTVTQLQSLSNTQLTKLDPTKVTNRIGDFTVTQLQSLSNTQFTKLDPTKVANRIGDFTVTQLQSLSNTQLGTLTPEQIYTYAKNFTQSQLQALVFGLSDGLFSPQFGVVVGLAASIASIAAGPEFAAFVLATTVIPSLAGIIDSSVQQYKNTSGSSSTGYKGVSKSSTSASGISPTVIPVRNFGQYQALLSAISVDLGAFNNGVQDINFTLSTSIQNKLQILRAKSVASNASLLKDIANFNKYYFNLNKFDSLKKKFEAGERNANLVNLAFMGNSIANASTTTDPTLIAFYALSAVASLSSALDKTLQDKIDGKSARAQWKAANADLQSLFSSRNMSAAQLTKARSDWSKDTAMVAYKDPTKNQAFASKAANYLKYGLGLGVQIWALEQALQNYDSNNPSSVAALSTAVAAISGTTLKLVGTGLESLSNVSCFTNELRQAKLMQLSTAFAVGADVINVMATGALLGMAVYNYQHARGADKIVGALEITDASIQVAFAVAEFAIATAMPVAGSGIAEILAVVSSLMPSLTGAYITEQMAKSFNTLFTQGLTNDALVVEAAYDIAFVTALPFASTFSAQATTGFNNDVLKIIKNNTEWFKQTEQQRLNFAYNSGGMSSIIGSLTSAMNSLKADSAQFIYLDYDSFDYLSGSQEYKAQIQGVATLSVGASQPSGFNLSGSTVTFNKTDYIQSAQSLTLSTAQNTSNFFTVAAATKDKDTLTINATQSSGNDSFDINYAGVTIKTGNGKNTVWLNDSVSKSTGVISSNSDTKIYLQNSAQSTDAYTKTSSKFGDLSLDNFVSTGNAYSPRVYGSIVGENVSGSFDNEVYFSSSNYDIVNLTGKNVMVSVGTGSSVNLTGVGASVYVDMNMAGELGLTADSGSITNATIKANYGDSFLSLTTTDQLTIAQNATSASVNIGSSNIYYSGGIFDINYVPSSGSALGSEVVASGFNFLQGSSGNDYYAIDDQSTIASANRLQQIMTGSGNNIVDIFDSTNSLTVILGSGENSVILNSGAAASVVDTATTSNKVSNIVVNESASLIADLSGNDSITAADDSSYLAARIYSGNHTISTAGSSTFVIFDANANSSTIINNYDAIPNKGASLVNVDLTAFDESNLYAFRGSDGTLELVGLNGSGSTAVTADILLAGDLSCYLLNTSEGYTKVALAVSDLLSVLVGSSNLQLNKTLTYNGNVMTAVSSLTCNTGNDNSQAVTLNSSGTTIAVLDGKTNASITDNAGGSIIRVDAGSFLTSITNNSSTSDIVNIGGAAQINSLVGKFNVNGMTSAGTYTPAGGYGLQTGTHIMLRGAGSSVSLAQSSGGQINLFDNSQAVTLNSSGTTIAVLDGKTNASITDNAGGSIIRVDAQASANVFGNLNVINASVNAVVDFTGHNSSLIGDIGATFYVYGSGNQVKSRSGAAYITTTDTGISATIQANGQLLIQALSAFAAPAGISTPQLSSLANQSTQWLATHH
jgi:hypothetical protein